MLWSPQEILDLHLPWTEFTTRYPHRSRSAWRQKRKTQPLDPPTPLYDAYIGYHREVQRQLVLPRTFTVTLDAQQPIAIAFLSDMHIGGEGTDIERIRRDLETIARTPRLYVALGGDVIDNFILKHMGHAAQESDLQVKAQWQIFCELMQIVQEKVLMVGSGNHDAWTVQAAQIDGVLAALRDWPTVYTGEGGLIELHLGRQTYRLYRKHTPNRSRSRKHPTNTVVEELMCGEFDFDLGVMEHQHEPAVLQFLYRTLPRVALRCGTYKIRDSYSETLGMIPQYGVPTVVFDPFVRRMTPFWSMTDAMIYLEVTPGKSLPRTRPSEILAAPRAIVA